MYYADNIHMTLCLFMALKSDEYRIRNVNKSNIKDKLK